jgi:AcrR family transcriptional regulator
MTEAARTRRAYDSPVRRQRAAETRERILTSGAELLHGFPTWNWSELTVRAVAERAGVTERTVYRYFATERALRDAVLERLEEESGVDVAGLALDDVAAVTARMLEYVSSFPVAPRAPRDDTVAAANVRQRAALLAALEPHAAPWSGRERAIAAAVLDVLWSVVSYERMVVDWELAPEDAILGLTWTIRLVEAAVRTGVSPFPEGICPETIHSEDIHEGEA